MTKKIILTLMSLFACLSFLRAQTYDLVVARDGSGNYTTVQAAIDAAPNNGTTPFKIFIKNGTYKEKITVPSSKPFLQLIGESVANVVLTYDDYSGKPMPGGGTFGTSNSASVTINANDFVAVNISFENTTGESPQALAINVNGDRCAFKNCRFLGGQDTLLANGAGKRQYYKQCYIDGTVDFIFGNAIAVFEDCTIYPKTRSTGSGNSYITAANTQAGQTYGYVFKNCIIQMNRGTTAYFLGRPWQNTSTSSPIAENKTVWLNSVQSGSIILPVGWSTWDATTNTAIITYAEYQSVTQTGAAVDISQRVSWSQQLNATQAANYTNSNIFTTWDPCSVYQNICVANSLDIAVANFKGTKGASTSVFTWNASWGIPGVTYTLYRSTDNQTSFQSIYNITSTDIYDVNFSYTDNNPPAGSTYHYYVVATKTGLAAHTTSRTSISSAPMITAGTLNPFLQGLGAPSATQYYTLSAVNLLGNLTITPPTNFQISLDNGITWSSTPLSIVPTNNTIASRTVAVRLYANVVDSITDSIVHTSQGATNVSVITTGTIQSAPLAIPINLAHFPMTSNNLVNNATLATGVTAAAPTFARLTVADGTTVPTVPAYSTAHGQAFAPSATGLWSTASGGPGGNLNRTFYEQFTIQANADYRVRVDSIALNCAFHNTSSNTRLAVWYSKSGFTADSASFTDGILGATGLPITLSPNGTFATAVALPNEVDSVITNFRLALNGSAGVTLNAGEVLTVRLYFSCSSSSSGRYGKVKDVYFRGVQNSTVPPPPPPPPTQQLAFPTAEGGGRYALGGRGGEVYEVTNLNDAGAGSLRDAVSVGNRTIVFRVSGEIRLQSRLVIRQNNITIAGQTAPGDGICLTGNTLNIQASNIIIRYIRCRFGDFYNVEDDAINCYSGNYQNIIIDHCSFSWSIDETATFYSIKNFTLQWCIISESLFNSIHNKGEHGYAGIWGGENATYHHNLIAHHTSRTPRFNGTRYTDQLFKDSVNFCNNVIYNWGNINSAYGGEGGFYNMINNYYKAGPATPGSLTVSSASNKRNRIFNYTSFYYNGVDTVWGGKFYVNGNYVHGFPDVTADNWTKGMQKDSYANAATLLANARQANPFSFPPIQMQTAEEAFTKVMDSVGAILPCRDMIDRRIVYETRNGIATFEGPTYAAVTGTGISHPSGIIDKLADVGGIITYYTTPAPTDTDRDGMPDSYELSVGLNPNNAADRNNVGAGGYTQLEIYLNGIVASCQTRVNTTEKSSLSNALLAPNPTQNEAKLSFVLENEQQLDIKIFDQLGSVVKVIATDQKFGAGEHTLNLQTGGLTSGTYFVIVKSDKAYKSLALVKQ